jgi:tetratricopeptide (TPR) repeat protein
MTDMSYRSALFKCVVTALLVSVGVLGPAAAELPKLDDLFGQLATAETPEAAARIENEIYLEWSKSGSAAIDLLLRRGQDAIDAGESVLAAEHFTAAIDHAPDFAEAYHGRATAYYLSGQLGPALDDLRQTLVLNPRHFPAMRGFAIILEELGREEQALEVYRKVQDINPEDTAVGEAVARLELALEGRAL